MDTETELLRKQFSSELLEVCRRINRDATILNNLLPKLRKRGMNFSHYIAEKYFQSNIVSLFSVYKNIYPADNISALDHSLVLVNNLLSQSVNGKFNEEQKGLDLKVLEKDVYTRLINFLKVYDIKAEMNEDANEDVIRLFCESRLRHLEAVMNIDEDIKSIPGGYDLMSGFTKKLSKLRKEGRDLAKLDDLLQRDKPGILYVKSIPSDKLKPALKYINSIFRECSSV